MKAKRGKESSSNVQEFTAEAVVIGCSQNNPTCSHEIHPSREDFYTIDIDSDLNPDLRLDIVQDEIPESLINRFKLTILEYLPNDTYNHDELRAQMTGYSGQNGLDNVRKMTDENGFIMIVGSSRDYGFRSSLAGLKYLEIAENDEGGCVLIIPKNQSLTFEEVKKQMDDLPLPLKAAIEKATERDHPLRPTEFCNLNYQVSDQNKALISALDKYVSVRRVDQEYTKRFNFLGSTINFGYSKEQKINAANALMQVLLGNKPIDSLAPHQGPLANGLLGRIVQNHLHGQPIQNLIHSSTKDDVQSIKPVSDVDTLDGTKIKPSIKPSNYDDQLKKLNLLNRYSNKPRSEEEDEQEKERLSNLAKKGIDTFLSYEDLRELANNGEKFFIPPTASDGGCLSCGDGHFYKGTLVEIHDQVQTDLNVDPENAKLSAGLARINKELLAKPHLACPKQDKFTSIEPTSQEQDLTSRNSIATQTK